MTDVPELIATDDNILRPTGAWTVANAEILEELCERVPSPRARTIDLSRVTALDTVGAWLFERLARRFSTPSSKMSFVAVPETYSGLMQELHGVNRRPQAPKPRGNVVLDYLERIGRGLANESAGFLQMIGTEIDRIPFRHLCRRERDHFGGETQCGCRREDVCPACKIFLDDVVLCRALQFRAVNALLVRQRGI